MQASVDYSKKRRNELVALCKEAGLKGYSTKKKAELIELLEGTVETKASANVGIVKPFLKWVGGKTQILEKLLSKFPKMMKSYHEPFLGGGSVLLGVLSLLKAGQIQIKGKIYASDLNFKLINLYKHIQTNVDTFIDELNNIKEEFESITGTEVNRKPKNQEEAITSKESYYYWIRKQFNDANNEGREAEVLTAAMFLFLNKTCFRGVYREGPNGFNVPYGNYPNPGILDEEHLRGVSELIQDVKFKVQSYESALKKVQLGQAPALVSSPEERMVHVGDFVYLDPPYAPENEKSFVGYTEKGFTLEDNNKLFTLCKKMPGQFLMSNADVQLVRNAFLADRFETEVVECRRAINSKKPDAKTNEVLIAPLSSAAVIVTTE